MGGHGDGGGDDGGGSARRAIVICADGTIVARVARSAVRLKWAVLLTVRQRAAVRTLIITAVVAKVRSTWIGVAVVLQVAVRS